MDMKKLSLSKNLSAILPIKITKAAIMLTLNLQILGVKSAKKRSLRVTSK